MKFVKKIIILGITISIGTLSAENLPYLPSACVESDVRTNPIAITAVERGVDGQLVVSLSTKPLNGPDPEFAVILVSSESFPSLDYSFRYGGDAIRNQKSVVSPINGKRSLTVRIGGLDLASGYYIYSMGYRCNINSGGNTGKLESVWSTAVFPGTSVRAYFKPNGGSTEATSTRPISERFDIPRISGKFDGATLIHVRMELERGSAELPFKIRVGYGGNNIRPTLGLNKTFQPSASYRECLQEITSSGSTSPYNVWHGYSYDVGRNDFIWGDFFLLLPLVQGPVSLQYEYDVADEYTPLQIIPQVLPANGNSEFTSSVQKGASALVSEASVGLPTAVPLPDNQKAWLIAGIAIAMNGISASDDQSIATHIDRVWSTVRSGDFSTRAISLFVEGESSLQKRFKDGISKKITPELINSDASASPDGWSLVSRDNLLGLERTSELRTEVSNNVNFYGRLADGSFVDFTSDLLNQTSNSRSGVVLLSKVVAQGNNQTLYDVLSQNGLWVRAQNQSTITPVSAITEGSDFEKYFGRICVGTLNCVNFSGSVDRSSVISERLENTDDGVRRSNYVEMLPGERRIFTLTRSSVLPSEAALGGVQVVGCTGGVRECSFSVNINQQQRNSFTVVSTPQARTGFGRFRINLLEGSDVSEGRQFVLDLNAQIFSGTNLVIKGGDYERSDAAIRLYHRAANIYRDYLISKNAGANVIEVNCRERSGLNNDPQLCFDYLNRTIASYSQRANNKIQSVLWFGHGTDRGYPLSGYNSDDPEDGEDAPTAKSWIPNYSRPSFEPGARFVSFACNGATNPGMSAFAAAWGTNIIANPSFVSPIGFARKNGTWVPALSPDASTDVVFLTNLDGNTPSWTATGRRRGVLWDTPSGFTISVPSIDPVLGTVTFETSSYSLANYPMFEQNSQFNFPVIR